MKTLKLDDNHDLALEGFNFMVLSDADAIVQRVKTRLLLFMGEWYLDTTAGVPYYQEIFVKNPDLGLVENVFKAAILETEGINELLEFAITFVNREMTITYRADTIYGEITDEVTA